jgi:predicted metal-dependent hydrolase
LAAVVITGSPDWIDEISAELRENGASVLHYTDEAGYVARLTDDRAALILVDGGDPRWRFWTTTPKTSNATRRVPIVVITDSPHQRDEALRSGANLVLAVGELLDQIPLLLTELARVPNPARLAELARQCGDPLPPEAVEAVRKFNAGEYYKQHDLFEALWMQEEGPVRELYRAVLQVGIGYFQITRGNGRGALKMLLRSVQWLAPLPDVCQGINVAQLRADAARVRAELERVGDNLDQFDHSLLKPVQMVENQQS